MNTPKTHPLNVSYLVVGLVFLGISGAWALRTSGLVDTADVQWLIPLTLVVAGVVGLVAFAAKGLTRGRHDEIADEPAYDPYPSYEDPYPTTTDPSTDPTTRLDDLTRGEDR
jgi:hypothetical protein